MKVPAKATKLPGKSIRGRLKNAALSGDGKSDCWQFLKVPAMF
jgi:hypothetical protein